MEFNSTAKIITSFCVKRENKFYKNFIAHRQCNLYFPYELILSYYTVVLIVIGTICNLTSFCIMLKKNMRKYSCMRFLCILTLSDTIVLFQWNMNTFFKYNLSVAPLYSDLEEISLFWCRWISYFAFSSLQTSSWLLCMVSLDRFMIVYAPFWKNFISKNQRVNFLIGLIVLTIFGLNLHIVFLNGFRLNTHNSYENILTNSNFSSSSSSSNGAAETVVCYQTKQDRSYIFPKWQKVHLIIYNIIPFSIMLFCNLMIIYNIVFVNKVKSQTKSTNKRKRRMTILLLLVTFSFMFLTLPSVIVHSFLREVLSDKPYRRLVNMIVNNLLHTSHSINFFLYIFSAPNFRDELKILFQKIPIFSKSQHLGSRNTATSRYMPTKNSTAI